MERMRATRLLAAAAVSFAVFGSDQLQADDWPAAKPITIFTEDASRFIRILPGVSLGDLVGFSGAAKGRYATAELYVRQPDRSYRLMRDVRLVNPVAPVNALLAPSGAFITFDNWHNLGYGRIVAIYAADGSLVRDYALEDLYPAQRLGALPRSTSSRSWRCAPNHFVAAEGAEVYVPEHFGGHFVFQMKDGTFRYTPGARQECNPVPRSQP
jgi:hypothetical protein